MRKRAVCIILIFLASCMQVFCADAVMNRDTFPYLIDTSTYTTIKKQETYQSFATCDYLYVGKYRDTITVNYSLRLLEKGESYSGNNGVEGYSLSWILDGHYPLWEQSAIEVNIDTTKKIKDRDFTTMNWETVYYEAYPVLLRNVEEDTIMIGLQMELALLLEAKDSLGNWQLIEEEIGSFCGMELGGVLPPNEVVLTSVGIYQGAYETDLRLRIGNNYSLPFRGFITYSQLESEFKRRP